LQATIIIYRMDYRVSHFWNPVLSCQSKQIIKVSRGENVVTAVVFYLGCQKSFYTENSISFNILFQRILIVIAVALFNDDPRLSDKYATAFL